MDFTKVVILVFVLSQSAFCRQDAQNDDMLLDDQLDFTKSKIVDSQNDPILLSSELDKMSDSPLLLSANSNDADNLEKKTLERLIKALSEKESKNMPEDMSNGAEIRMPSTGDEPMPLGETMTQDESDSASASVESSGEMPSDGLEIWEHPEVFDSVIGIPGDATEGATVLQVTAQHPMNLSMDFLCINPENVFCYSDKLADNKYQLRIALSDVSNIPSNFVVKFHVLIPDDSGTDAIYESKTYSLNFSYEFEPTTLAPVASKSTIMNVVVNPNQIQAAHNTKPVFEFMPQFERESYDVLVPEGMNEKPMVMAIIYFMSRVNGPAPLFKVLDDNLQWFEIGEITSQQDPNRVVSAVKLVLKGGVNAVRKDVSLPYQFAVEAMQGELTAQAHVNVDFLSFDEPEIEKTEKPEVVRPAMTRTPATVVETTEVTEATTPTTVSSTSAPKTTPKATTAATTTAERVTESTSTVPSTTASTSTVPSTTVAATTTTKPTTQPMAAPEIEINLAITGATNHQITVSELLRNGEVVPGVEIHVTADQDHHTELVDLEMLMTDAFIIRPRRIPIGGSAQLIVADNRLLDFESTPTTFSAEIRASLTNNPNVIKSQKINFVKKDELDHAPYFSQSSYEFEIPENSITGEAVGQLSVQDEDKDDELTFELFGEFSELFTVNDGVLIVSCKTALPCLDREQVDSYYFSLVATDKSGYTSDPVTVIIRVIDKNDNSPSIQLTEEMMRISNGELLAPFVFTVIDADLVPSYVIETDGSAAGFLNVSQIAKNLYQIKPKNANVPSSGNFDLELIARDPSNESFGEKKMVKVQVKNTISKAHFRRGRYERTISSEKIHKGNPLVQLELEGVPIDTVIFVILNNNPGWLAIDDYGGNVFVGDAPASSVTSGHYTVDIGVIDRGSKTILAQTQFILTVVGSRKTGSIFRERAYTHSTSKEGPIANTVVTMATTEEKPNLVVISESITAWNTDQKSEHFPASALAIEGSNAVLNAEHTAKLRTVQFQVASVEDMNDRALVTVYFSSDADKVAKKRKQNSKPKFVEPWTAESMVIHVKLVEEAPIGQVAVSLPAYDPMTGNRILNVELSGQMAEFFSIDPATQDVLVAKRLDFETFSMEMKSFDLELIAGEDDYKTAAILRFQIIDIDDNRPRIEFLDNSIRNNNIVVMENAPPGTEIARFRVIDDDVLDGKQKFSYRLSGFHHENFQIREMADHMVIVVSPAGELDRERDDKMEIVVRVADSAGNANVADLTVTLDDQNDNAPKFAEDKVTVKVTENWQIGSTVTRLLASDSDINENSRLSYLLGDGSNPYFEVDAETGDISTAKSLNGLARVDPYKLTVVCKDNGNPSLSSEAVVLVTVVESILISNEDKNELTIKNPPIGYVLKINENIPANHRIYQIQAQLGSFDIADIKYSLTPISKKDDGWLNIDETSGEIFTAQQLDYETTKKITVLITARAIFQEGKSDSRLLYVEIIDENDNEPIFAQKSQEAPYLFVVTRENEEIGKVVARDSDTEPFNQVYYYLLPSCSNRRGDFSIDIKTGEVTINKPLSAFNESRTHLCALASPVPDLGSAPEIAFDRHNLSMTTITVRQSERIAKEQKPADPIVVFKNNSHVTLDRTLMDVRIPITNNSASETLLSYRISGVDYTKAEYDGNVAENQKLVNLFSLSPTTGDLHIDSDLTTRPEGLYKISVEASEKATNKHFAALQSEVHFVNSNVKLKFVFDQSRDVMGLNLVDFQHKLTNAVRSEGLGSDLTVYLSRPEVYQDAEGTNTNKSSVCLYVVRGSTILSLEHAIEAISASANSESPLTRLYQVYKVVNIDRCSETVSSRRIGQFLSPYTIVWIIIILVCLLILMAMFGYMCFLARYRDYLKRKELNFAARIEKHPPADDFTIPQYININLNQ